MEKTIVIIDGNSLINRAYYAMQRPMITKEGIYTQGIYGFLNMLNKIIEDYEPSYMAVAWDRKSPTFRHQEYAEYKAGRKKMPTELAMELPIMKEILAAMNISSFELDGFEADDIIGTIARISEEEGLNPLIITGDKDALQLATHTTKVLITRRGITDFDIYDFDKMVERYQLTPEQFIDLKGLMGDQSDNIPGIPGVGEKTGIKLLTQFGSVANLLANTDQISNAKLRTKVEENAMLAAMSRRLATINKYVPIDYSLEDLQFTEPEYDKLIDLYIKLEFNSFLKKLNISGSNNIGVKTQSQKEQTENIEYEKIVINNLSELDAVNAALDEKSVFIKVFNDKKHVGQVKVHGISLLCGNKYFYINASEAGLLDGFILLLNNKKPEFAGHNLIEDYYALMSHGFNAAETLFDTCIAAYLIEPSKADYNIKNVAFEYLREEIPEEKKYIEDNGQLDLLGNVSDPYEEYGFIFLDAVRRLTDLLKSKIEEMEMEEVFYKVELPLIEVLASMEKEGFSCDENVLNEIGLTLEGEIEKTESEIFNLAGTEFNINSPVQLGDVLFERLGLPAGKKTKRGYSTSADVLDKLKDKHPIIEQVLYYRTVSKLKSTYVDGLKPLIGSDGKIRAHFQQTVTATGRISCTAPNLQNIPVRNELGRNLRKAFVPSDDGILIGADYSQIELRVLAHLSGDESLINAFNNGDDIHKNTAARVFNLSYDEVTSLDRSRAKAVNFGVIYGMSGFGLSEELHITRKEAEKYIAEYFDKHQKVKAYMDKQISDCKENRYTKTIMGRKRFIHEINASNFMVRQAGERLAMNSPIQGSAADIIKLAMIKVYREIKERGLKSKLILQVHDELIIDTDKSETEIIKELLVRNMENAMNLSVKLESDMNEGKTWYLLK